MTEALQRRPVAVLGRRALRIADPSTTDDPPPTTPLYDPRPTTAGRRGAALVPLHERDLARLWEAGALPAEAIVALDGTPLQVVYRGRPNHGAGPDFRDAVIALPDAGLLHGDVELHLIASDFRRHGHDRDPAYARVVLHLVYRADDGPTTALPGGRRARVVALEPWLSARAVQIEAMLQQPALWREPCQSAVERMGAEAVAETLARLGERRLREKTAPLLRRPPAVALYEGLLRTLGHGPHTGAWLELARRLPAARIAEVARTAADGPAPPERVLEALLLAAAGLLPPVAIGVVQQPSGSAGGPPAPATGQNARGPGSRSSSAVAAGINRAPTESGGAWGDSASSPTAPAAVPDPADPAPSTTTYDLRRTTPSAEPYLLDSWQIWRAWGAPAPSPISVSGPRRPANHPARRLAGLARLLQRGPDGLLQRARAALLAERAPAQALLDVLTVEADGGWRAQAFPWSAAPAPGAALIGREKAVELALNAVLPVLLAEAERERRPLLEAAVLRAFHALPSAGAYGRTAHLARALRADAGSLLRGADRAQGALHLYAHYCTQGGCGRCPLS